MAETAEHHGAENQDDAVSALSGAEERFERWRRRSGLVLAPALGIGVYLLTRGRLEHAGASRLCGVLAAVCVLWITEAIPLPAAALLGPALCVLLGVQPPGLPADASPTKVAGAVFAPFADPIIFLFMGSFMLAQAMSVHKLDKRMALAVLSWRWVGGRPLRVLAALAAVTAGLSMWVSNTATAAMMLPIALGLLRALAEARGGDPRRWPYATGMMLMIAYAASLGGIGTPVGSPPNLIGLAALRKAGYNITFFQWMALGVPIGLAMCVAMLGLLVWLHPVGKARGGVTADLRVYLQQQRAELGGWTRGQVNTLIAFGGAVTLWILPGVLQAALGSEHAGVKLMGTRLQEAVVAVLAASVLFVLPVNFREGKWTLTWAEAAKIDWGTILLFGGGMSFGLLMDKLEVAKALGNAVITGTGVHNLWALTALAITLAIAITEVMSNTAAATMLMPVVIGIATAAGVSPVPPAIGACLGASFAFMLPVSTPPNAIVYGSGLVPVTRMVRAGVLLDLVGIGVVWLGLRVLCPVLGLG